VKLSVQGHFYVVLPYQKTESSGHAPLGIVKNEENKRYLAGENWAGAIIMSMAIIKKLHKQT
jgi:hypothetical protein